MSIDTRSRHSAVHAGQRVAAPAAFRMRRLAIAAIVLSLVSCRSDGPAAPRKLPALDASATVVIERDPQSRGDSAVFVVRIVGTGTPIAAFQGVVTFSPGALQVMSVSTPAGGPAEYRVVNDRELAAGRLRFAAFAPEAFASTEAFRFAGRLSGTLSAAALTGTLDVAGAAGGSAVRRDALVRSDGVHDAATNRLLTP